MRDWLFVLLQYLLPKYLMTAIVYRVARIRTPAIKDWLITRFVSVFKVETGEVAHAVPGDFATFNDFFIRELADGERPVDAENGSFVSPVDGKVSQCGRIRNGRIIQAKGIDYSIAELLAVDIDDAALYQDGRFATIYLAPFNYHRVHAPFAGELGRAHYVPGDLYSVNEATAKHVRGLFRRNERLNLHFETDAGPVFLSMVGALNVGSISTPWTGEIRPRKTGVVSELDLSAHSTSVSKGDLLGWFNMGSTVVMLARQFGWNEQLTTGSVVKMGEAIGRRLDT